MKAIDWPDLRRSLTRQSRRAFRRKLREISLEQQEQVWQSIADAFPNQRGECEAELRVIHRVLKAIERQVPSGTWYNDARQQAAESLTEEHHLNADGRVVVVRVPSNPGGQWPPGGTFYEWSDLRARRGDRMVRAAGETRLYPASYITVSGHSYDAYVQHLYAHGVQRLMDDGYQGGIVQIYDLHPGIRSHYRQKANGKAGASNTVSDDPGIPRSK